MTGPNTRYKQAMAICELQQVAAHYRWAQAEYRNQLRKDVATEELERFRKWIIQPARQELAAIIREGLAAIIREGLSSN